MGYDSPETRSGQLPDPDEMVDVNTIAARCGVEAVTVRSWKRRGHLDVDSRRFGGALVYRWADVEVLPIVRRALGRPQASDG